MLTNVIWRLGGRLPWIRFIVFGWRPRIFLHRPAVRSGSSLVGDHVHSRSGFLVRDDQLLPTTAVRIALARQREWTSPLDYYPLAFSRPHGGA